MFREGRRSGKTIRGSLPGRRRRAHPGGSRHRTGNACEWPGGGVRLQEAPGGCIAGIHRVDRKDPGISVQKGNIPPGSPYRSGEAPWLALTALHASRALLPPRCGRGEFVYTICRSIFYISCRCRRGKIRCGPLSGSHAETVPVHEHVRPHKTIFRQLWRNCCLRATPAPHP